MAIYYHSKEGFSSSMLTIYALLLISCINCTHSRRMPSVVFTFGCMDLTLDN